MHWHAWTPADAGDILLLVILAQSSRSRHDVLYSRSRSPRTKTSQIFLRNAHLDLCSPSTYQDVSLRECHRHHQLRRIDGDANVFSSSESPEYLMESITTAILGLRTGLCPW
ncbi:hypothetical protein BDN67DRAFT_968921 [Paxillus ammoniavirescens]|nr:hypothetical protein BDN67DRAFT_968921 [Paxillus ammoniavirescens]